MNLLRVSLALCAAVWVTAIASSASAAEKWALFQVDARQVDPGAAMTFRDLLQAEITKRNGVTVFRIEEVCADITCAVAAAKPTGADVAVTVSLSSLGEKVFVTVQAFDVADNEPKSSQQMKIDRVEELDLVAARVAEAFASYANTDQTAELGTVTSQEAKPDTRRDADAGFALGLGTLIPLQAYTNETNIGMLVDLGYWYEGRHFAIYPRWGFRFHTDSKDEGGSYFEMPIDIGGFWMMSTGDFSPYLGGGAGIRYIGETRRVHRTLGTVVAAESVQDISDSIWGPSLYGRVGVMMMRTYTMRISLAVDYNITFGDLNDDKHPQSVTAILMAVF